VSRNVDTFRPDGGLGARLRDAKARPSQPPTNGRHRNQSGEAGDEVLKLVQRVFILPRSGTTPSAVAFCGVNRGAGCTWLCARAGEALAAQVSGSVCLLDANLRAPSLHSQFGVEVGTGFADFMRTSKPAYDFARRMPALNLWLITAGAVGGKPNGALCPSSLRSRFAELRNEFDFVLVDTPAVDFYADALLLGQLTDGIILVVGSNSTRRETALDVKKNFQAAQVPLLGAVLNKRMYPIPEAIYRKI
jgi:protein-tyrosine kinase